MHTSKSNIENWQSLAVHHNTMLQKLSRCEVNAKNEFLQVVTLVQQFGNSEIHLPLNFVLNQYLQNLNLKNWHFNNYRDA